MITPKEKNKTDKQDEDEMENSSINTNDTDEKIYSDGSGEAFEQTEEVNEDNFDDLKEK